jgi:hypothetical protein
MNLPTDNALKDLWLAPARGLAAKSVFVMTASQLAALIIYNLFFYSAHIMGGSRLSTVFAVFGLAPTFQPALRGLIPWGTYCVGISLSILVIMFGFTAVARIAARRLDGDRFYALGAALSFAKSRVKQLVLIEISVAAFVAFVLLLFTLAGLLGRIPVAGEWLYAIFTVFPVYFVALFLVFVLAVAAASVLIAPAVVAQEEEGETFQAILETFALVMRRPLRWLGYTAYSMVGGKLASFVYAYFAYRAVQFTAVAFGLTDGGAFRDLVRSALAHLPVDSGLIKLLTTVFPGVNIGFSLADFVQPGRDDAVVYVMAFMLTVIALTVSGYFLSVVATGQAYGYRLMRDRLLTPDRTFTSQSTAAEDSSTTSL